MIRFYGSENVIKALKNDITYLSDMTMEAVCIPIGTYGGVRGQIGK